MMWVIRLFFPNAGWYTFHQSDFDIPDKVGPNHSYYHAKSYEDKDSYFNVWVRFCLW